MRCQPVNSGSSSPSKSSTRASTLPSISSTSPATGSMASQPWRDGAYRLLGRLEVAGGDGGLHLAGGGDGLVDLLEDVRACTPRRPRGSAGCRCRRRGPPRPGPIRSRWCRRGPNPSPTRTRTRAGRPGRVVDVAHGGAVVGARAPDRAGGQQDAGEDGDAGAGDAVGTRHGWSSSIEVRARIGSRNPNSIGQGLCKQQPGAT